LGISKTVDLVSGDIVPIPKYPSQLKLHPTGLTALNVDIKKSSTLNKNNPNLTERTTNSSSHLKDEYNRFHNDSQSKKKMEMYLMKDLQKQIGRSATPYIQEIYKHSANKNDGTKLKSVYIGGALSAQKLTKNRSMAGQLTIPKNLSHLRSKSHSKIQGNFV
jgi:hypothetical protein